MTIAVLICLILGGKAWVFRHRVFRTLTRNKNVKYGDQCDAEIEGTNRRGQNYRTWFSYLHLWEVSLTPLPMRGGDALGACPITASIHSCICLSVCEPLLVNLALEVRIPVLFIVCLFFP